MCSRRLAERQRHTVSQRCTEFVCSVARVCYAVPTVGYVLRRYWFASLLTFPNCGVSITPLSTFLSSVSHATGQVRTWLHAADRARIDGITSHN